ncbi:phenylacetate-coenzyme A ligase PaaK-like adenylate-forming protein [Bradyrhizobium sp. GM24.11]
MASTKLKEGGHAYRAELDAQERAPRDEIMALQKQRLAWSLKHAYDNVAHYRKAFDEAGVHPSDFRELSDLAKFPFTVKTDLRDNYPFNMFAVPRGKSWCACMRPPARRASRSSSAIPSATSRPGRR